MINTGNIFTEESLAETLARCGFASEPLGQPTSAIDSYLFSRLGLARRLTGEQYKDLYVALEDGALLIYSWIMVICKLRGEVAEETLAEKIELCASPNRAPAEHSKCICLDLPLPFYHYEELKHIGVDLINGRYGQVTLKRCLHCQRLWLHYFVEYEAFSRSGRYFMGVITPQAAETITAETAVEYLESLDWHLYGGSYFDGKAGRSTSHHVQADC